MSNTFSEKLTSSRGIGVALGIGAAVLAGILLLVYLNQYRNSVSGDNAPTSVIVAKALIPAGTSGTIIGAKPLYQPTTLPKKEVKVGAIADPAYINGRVAVADILPGQQMTTADFTVPTTDVGGHEDHRLPARRLGPRRRDPDEHDPDHGRQQARPLRRDRRRDQAVPAVRDGARRARPGRAGGS